MYTIKIDISDTIYDNVMFFLNNLPKKVIKKEDTLTWKRNKTYQDSVYLIF